MNLPKGWAEVNLFDICKPKQWKTIPVKSLTEEGYVVYGANGKIGYFSSYTHEKPTVMITCRGATCGNIHISEPFAYINGNAMALDELNANIDLKYLYYFLRSRNFEDVISGSAQPQITQEGLKVVNIPLAPFSEQKCIAQKLDELLVTVQSIKTRLDHAPTIIKRFRQSILAAATSGKLTEDWREENGISDEWEDLTVDDVATVATGKTPLKSNKSYYENGDIPWLTSSVTGNEFVNETDSFVTQQAIDECKLKIFDPGTLLVAMYGEGKTRGQVTETTFPAAINQACAAIIVDGEKIEKSYLKLKLLENYVEIRMLAEGGNQPNLNLSKVRSISVPTPSIEEQKEIVSQVESLFSLVNTLEEKITATTQLVDKLTQSILAKAFRGELVEQDPEDESAEDLLERIRAEQEQEKPKKTRKKKG